MKAVIMAGGIGQRLRPLTHIIPKPLLPVGERSVLEITINNLKEHGCTEVVLATNYKSDLFESYFGDGSKFGIHVVYSKEEKPLGTAGPLLLVRHLLHEPFLVMNGDILTNLDFNKLRKTHLSSGADITIVTKIIEIPFHYGVVESEGDQVIGLAEKPVMKNEILAGIYYLSPSVLDMIPLDTFYHMTTLIKDMIDQGKEVKKHVLADYWLDIGQMEDYHKAQDDYKNGYLRGSTHEKEKP